jgi:hypothetical protein
VRNPAATSLAVDVRLVFNKALGYLDAGVGHVVC